MFASKLSMTFLNHFIVLARVYVNKLYCAVFGGLIIQVSSLKSGGLRSNLDKVIPRTSAHTMCLDSSFHFTLLSWKYKSVH